MDDNNNNNDNDCNNIISINDILPVELIRRILLRLPVKHLVLLRCVSKLWHSLISDPNFAKSHLELSLAPTHRLLYMQDDSNALSFDLDALFHDHAALAAAVTKVDSLPPNENKTHPGFDVFGSCRGFILLYQYPHFFIIWNPLTGSHKRISCDHVVRNSPNNFTLKLLGCSIMLGFGYDGSKDDYLVLLAWRDRSTGEDYLDLFSLRTNSWKSSKVVLPNDPLRRRTMLPPGLFFNGAIHWLIDPPFESTGGGGGVTIILVFDLTKRSFSEIPVTEQLGMWPNLAELGGCLAVYFTNYDGKTEIWVMKEYRMQSPWTVYEIPSFLFLPVCLFKGGDFIGFHRARRGLAKYNVKGELLQNYADFSGWSWYTMYTESLLALPNDSEDEEKKKDKNHNEPKQGKRIKSAPTWTLDFYCN